MGWATFGVAGGPDPSNHLAGVDALAEADQVVLVVGVVVGRAPPVPQPQADPTPTPIEVAEAADVATSHRNQPGAGGRQQVDALMTAATAVAGGAPALPDPHRPHDRTHPTAWATAGWRGTVGEHEILDRRLAIRFLHDLTAAPPARGVPVPRLSDGLLGGRPRSPIEAALLRACIVAGLPKAEAQRSFVDYDAGGQEHVRTIPDFAWPDHQVAVYCDGWEFHSSPERRALDAERRTWLERQGWQVLAFWGREIVNQPEVCVARVADALGRS
jgi:REase_MTES_1575